MKKMPVKNFTTVAKKSKFDAVQKNYLNQVLASQKKTKQNDQKNKQTEKK